MSINQPASGLQHRAVQCCLAELPEDELMNAVKVGCLAFGAAAGLGMSVSPGLDVLQPEETALFRDKEGRVRCRIGQIEGGAGIELLDPKGVVVARLRSGPDGVVVALDDAGGAGGVELRSSSKVSSVRLGPENDGHLLIKRMPEGDVSVAGASAGGHLFRVASSADSGVELELTARGDDGGVKQRCTLKVEEDGCDLRMRQGKLEAVRLATIRNEGSLIKVGSEGRGVQVQSLVNGASGVLVSAGKGAAGLLLESMQNGEAGLSVLSPAGKRVLQLGVSELGQLVDTWAASRAEERGAAKEKKK